MVRQLIFLLLLVVAITTSIPAVLGATMQACPGEVAEKCSTLPAGANCANFYQKVVPSTGIPKYYLCAKSGSKCAKTSKRCEPVSAGGGGTPPSNDIANCVETGRVAGGVSYKCTAWGPVKFGDPESYKTLDTIPGTACTDALKQKCGCLGGGVVVLNIPNFRIAGQAEALNVRGSIINIVSGSGTLNVFQNSKLVATKSGATTPVAPDAGGSPLVLAPGQNAVTYQNSNEFIDAQSCFQLEYFYDLVDDADFNQALCGTRGGAWLESGPEGGKCCGDDQLPPDLGGDIFQLAENAICVKGANGWRWLTPAEGGKIVRIRYTPDGYPQYNYLDGEVVYTNAGPRLCGRVVPEFNDHLEVLNVHAFTKTTGGGDPFANTVQQFTHGYLCHTNGSTPAAIAECAGADAPLSEPSLTPQRTFSTGQSVIRRLASVNYPYYCRSDGQWSPSLDDNPQACAQAGREAKASGGGAAPIQWTGTRCCGEGGPEYYADPTPAVEPDDSGRLKPAYQGGGCWEGVPFAPVGKDKRFVDELIPDEANFEENGGTLPNASIINQNGTFHTCNLPVDDPILTGAGTCTASQTCNADGTISLVDGSCGRRTIRCPYGCQLSEESVCVSLDCPSGPTPICRTGPLACRGNLIVQVAADGTLEERTCPGNAQCVPAATQGQDASCASSTPSSTTMYAEIEGVLRLPTTVGCYASLFDSPDSSLNWPARSAETQACYSSTGSPRPFSNALECFSLKQANVQNEPFDKPAGITPEAHYLNKCIDWLASKPLRLQPSSAAKLVTDLTQNIFHSRAKEGLAQRCNCGVVLSRPPGLSDRRFALWCIFRDPRITTDECIGPPRQASADVVNQVFGRTA